MKNKRSKKKKQESTDQQAKDIKYNTKDKANIQARD